jgi:UDP-2,3-diacylglucosamine pyrophosphatase LpxH
LKEFYKTVIISELNFGSKESNIKAINNFLKYVQCELLILNGGVFENKKFGNTDKWKKKHHKFFSLLSSMIKTNNTKVVIVGGVNEYWMESFSFFQQSKFEVVKEYSINRDSGNYLVVPGDIYHFAFYKTIGIKTLKGFFAKFNFWFANRILRLNTNKTSKVFKRFGNFGTYISQFENFMTSFAKRKGYDGIICAHNHYPTIKKVDNMIYMNSGDWVKSFSALVEDENGLWQLSYHSASRSMIKKEEKSASLAKPTSKRKLALQ